MPVTIHISGESAGQTLEELFGLSRGLCGGADVGTCSPAPTAAEAAPAQPAAEEPAPAKRTRRTKAEIEAEKVAEELDAADKPAATEPAEDPEPATVEAEPVEQVSETDVRATVVEFLKTTDQDTQLGLAIFRKHGGNKLSEVPKENHAALVGELKNCIAAIGTGGATLAALRSQYGLKAAE